MKGDFSKWDFDPARNFSGVLQQQGRVLLDADWNAQTRVTGHWQDTNARDAIGPGVAAVPAETPRALRVTRVWVEGGEVKVELVSGRAWADGVLTYLGGEAEREVELTATYLEPPIHDPAIESPPTPGDRDAVVLEVWREAANGFQMPGTLIEPALGGPDTTERIHTAIAVRLLRLGEGESCGNIGQRLQSDTHNRGHLRVSLRPAEESAEPCPELAAGGYTGFEHHLYRVEIARVNQPDDDRPYFKWSQFNGGLVGRGDFVAGDAETTRRIAITANTPAIASSGLTRFYLEVLVPVFEPAPGPEIDPQRIRHWRVSYAAIVDLNGTDLEVEDERFTEAELPAGNVFFRLWNGIEAVHDFPLAITPGQELRDGIVLEFDVNPGEVYHPGDYWTFPVRAGANNDSVLLHHQPPEGVQYHRVPLGELRWPDALALDEADITDCRRVFRPLTNQQICCSYTVGDGFSSHGDYDSIQEAVDKLPPWGGEICLLPGIHRGPVSIDGKFNIRIKGCGLRSLLLGRPVFRIVGSSHIAIVNMFLVSFAATPIEVENSPGIEIGNNLIVANRHGIRVRDGNGANIHHNWIRMLDSPTGEAAVYFHGRQGLIERNNIAAFPAGQLPPEAAEREHPDPTEDCVEPDEFEQDIPYVVSYLHYALNFDHTAWADVLAEPHPYRARGGIQIAGESERVRIHENRIRGGSGNGITLGSDLLSREISRETNARGEHNRIDNTQDRISGYVTLDDRPPDDVSIVFFEPDRGGRSHWDIIDSSGRYEVEAGVGAYWVTVDNPHYRAVVSDPIDNGEFGIEHNIELERIEPQVAPEALAWIYGVTIERNEISDMGRSGIGKPVLDLEDVEFISSMRTLLTEAVQTFGQVGNVVDLTIQGNHISHCLQQPLVGMTRIGGEGGISLGLCEHLSVRDNRIEDNGRAYWEPVCGIFARYAAEIEISGNRITNNGPLAAQAPAMRQPGVRGGIVLPLVSSVLTVGAEPLADISPPPGLLESNDVLAAAMKVFAAIGGYAARIHDNVVEQPVGQALRMIGVGPTTVCDNQFNVDIANDPSQWMESLAGALFVLNLGWPPHTDSVCVPLMPEKATLLEFAVKLLGGSTVVSNNELRLGVNLRSLSAQFIASCDDVDFSHNHSAVLAEVTKTLYANTFLLASTVRAGGNRLKEPHKLQEARFSLVSLARILNNTSDNQGDHCSVAEILGTAENKEKVVRNSNRSVSYALKDCAQDEEQDEDETNVY